MSLDSMPLDSRGLGSVTLGDADRAAAVAAIKARLRIARGDDDALLGAYAESALGLAEQFTGRVLIARDMAALLPAIRGWQSLFAAPVRSIDLVEGVAADGTASALPLDAYAIDIDARGGGWVRIVDAGNARRARVTLNAGLADGWAALPAAIREGVAMLAAYLHSSRDPAQPPPVAIVALWRPYRTMTLASAGHA